MKQIPETIESVVFSTRIRLARNLSAYPFPSTMKEREAAEVLTLVRKALEGLDRFQEYDMWKQTDEERMLLQEQHLISPALRKKAGQAATFVSQDKQVSVMVNEEDHLREQYIVKGFDLDHAYTRIHALDESLSDVLSFAYDKKLGYITACPTNLGTGMRASVMMFLPGLSRSKQIEKLMPSLRKGGMTVRGVFGEGSAAEGYLYQVSNERTLGLTEREILERLTQLTHDLCHLEINERKRMLRDNPIQLKDECLRAYGILTNCARLTEKELSQGLMKIRLGIALGFFEVTDVDEFNDFVNDLRPASFRVENSLNDAGEEECDEQRAITVGRELPSYVVKK